MELIVSPPGVGEADDLRLRRLRLQQERREILRVERHLHVAQHLAAVLDDDGRGVALERGAEGVVRGDEEPRVAARLHDGLAGAVGEHPGVVGPVDRVRRALGAREVGGGRARIDEDLVLLAHHLVHRECHARGRHVHDRVDALGVDPPARDLRADVGLVLVVGGDDLDLEALVLGREVLDRHLRGDHRARAAQVGVEARLVVQHPDLDHAARDLRVRRSRSERQCGRGRQCLQFESHFPSPLRLCD